MVVSRELNDVLVFVVVVSTVLHDGGLLLSCAIHWHCAEEESSMEVAWQLDSVVICKHCLRLSLALLDPCATTQTPFRGENGLVVM